MMTEQYSLTPTFVTVSVVLWLCLCVCLSAR